MSKYESEWKPLDWIRHSISHSHSHSTSINLSITHSITSCLRVYVLVQLSPGLDLLIVIVDHLERHIVLREAAVDRTKVQPLVLVRKEQAVVWHQDMKPDKPWRCSPAKTAGVTQVLTSALEPHRKVDITRKNLISQKYFFCKFWVILVRSS